MPNYQKGFSAIFIIIGIVIILAIGVGLYFSSNQNYTFLNTGKPDKPIEIGLLGEFDMSSNDQYLVFPYRKNNETNIYISKVDGSEAKIIKNTTDGYAPKFSTDNKKILFITYTQNDNKSENISHINHINIINLDGSDLRQIDVKFHIEEAVFNPSGDKIFFSGSTTFGHNSPVVKSAFHDFDIYSVNLSNSEITNITNKKYYSLSNLSITPDGSALSAKVFDGEDRLLVFSGDNFSIVKMMALKTNEKILGDIDIRWGNDFAAVYTTVSEESVKSSKYTYDLYVNEYQGSTIRRLTNLKSNLLNPIITSDKKKVLFLNWTNWSEKPPIFELMETGMDGNGLRKIDLRI